MKTNVFLFAALGTALLSSCNNDSVPANSENGEVKTARIELTLMGSSATRTGSTTDPSTGVATDEQTVNNIVVGIFNSSGDVLTVQSNNSPSTSVANVITCPLNAGSTYDNCSAVVVANVPASSITDLKSSTSKVNFLGKTISLSESTVSASGDVQVATKLPMSGDVKDGSNATFTLTPGGTKTGLAVELVRMASRITLTGISADFSSSPYPNAKFKLERVLLRDAISTTKVTTSATASDAMPTGATYLTGGDTWSGSSWTDTANPYLFNTLSYEVTGSSALPGSNYYWFYAFANSGSSQPTSFVIQGTFDEDGDFSAPGVSTVFYPVIVNQMQPGTTIDGTAYAGTSTIGSISRNKLYNLKVVLKNKGALSPTENINPADLSITVTVAPWPAAIVQEVAF